MMYSGDENYGDEITSGPLPEEDESLCRCGSGKPWWRLHDAQGIYVGRVCDSCVAEIKSHYRPEIFSGYSQADVDEPIEPE